MNVIPQQIPPTQIFLLSLQVHQREAQALARGLAIGSLGEDVAELRIRELVDGALQTATEVAPAITSGFCMGFPGGNPPVLNLGHFFGT